VYTEINPVYFECVVADGSYYRYFGMHHQRYGYIFVLTLSVLFSVKLLILYKYIPIGLLS